MVERLIRLPEKGSFFLFGPRQTGKSTLVEARCPKAVWRIDLLLSDLYLTYSKDPALFRRQALEKIQREGVRAIFIDEVQRVPLLLNEVQSLMGQTSCQFILTGSSARKLVRGGANLLAGRAVERHLFPLVHEECKDQFPLEEVLRFGSLPALLGKSREEKIDFLTTYVHTYLQEEVQAEGIVRNLGGFSRFLDMAAYQCGELLSFSAIAREVQLPIRTVQSYYEILEDTLIGFRLFPWRRSVRKRLSAHPKFFLFDLGVTNAINQRLTGAHDPLTRGKLFEQFLLLETHRLLHYRRSEANLHFWRTNHGAEVDLLIEKHGKPVAAFEIKSTPRVTGAHLSGIRAFQEEHPKTPCAVLCTAPHAHRIEKVRILPWQSYLKELPDLL